MGYAVKVYGPIRGDARMSVGQSTQLKIAGIDNVPSELQAGWTWSLGTGSDSAVATVSDDGTVTGKKSGTVTVTVSRGSGADQVSFSHRADVTTALLADAKVTIPRQTYSGKKLTPVPVVALNGTTLTAGIDYEVVGQDIVNAGFYDVVIQGRGIYEGKATGIFLVEPMRLTPPKPVTGLVYNGLPQTGVTEDDGYTLGGSVTETDVDVFYAFATVTITCEEGRNSEGTRTETFSICSCSHRKRHGNPREPPHLHRQSADPEGRLRARGRR